MNLQDFQIIDWQEKKISSQAISDAPLICWDETEPREIEMVWLLHHPMFFLNGDTVCILLKDLLRSIYLEEKVKIGYVCGVFDHILMDLRALKLKTPFWIWSDYAFGSHSEHFSTFKNLLTPSSKKELWNRILLMQGYKIPNELNGVDHGAII